MPTKNTNFEKLNTMTQFFKCLQGITTQNNCTMLLCAVYRPPINSKHLFVEEMHKLLHNTNKRIIDLLVIDDTSIDLQLDSPVKHKYSTATYNAGLVCGIIDCIRLEFKRDKFIKTYIYHFYARTHLSDLYTTALGTLLADYRMIAAACVGTPPIQDEYKYKLAHDTKKITIIK